MREYNCVVIVGFKVNINVELVGGMMKMFDIGRCVDYREL